MLNAKKVSVRNVTNERVCAIKRRHDNDNNKIKLKSKSKKKITKNMLITLQNKRVFTNSQISEALRHEAPFPHRKYNK